MQVVLALQAPTGGPEESSTVGHIGNILTGSILFRVIPPYSICYGKCRIQQVRYLGIDLRYLPQLHVG